MPPRAAKRASAARVGRRLVRGRAAAKVEAVLEESNNKAEDEEAKVGEEQLPVAMGEKAKEIENEEPAQAEGEKFYEDVKDASLKKGPAEDYEKGERLDLEDEPEEFYDEKEVEQEPREEGFGVGEELEEVYVVDELEHEEGDEHVAEVHAGMVEEEHKELVKERRKRKVFEIFVGGLDKDATEDDLRAVFSEVGEITEVRLMMNPQTKKNKGFAFLRFATAEQAKRACVELKNPVVNGKQCGVSPSHDSDTLFLGNICRTWTKETLIEKLKHYSVENLEDLTLVEDSNNDGMNRGFAFLEFASRSDAMGACKRLQNRNIQFGVDRPAKVSFADSFIDPGDEIMAQVKTVFVDGLPSSWKESYVKDLLKAYGEVVKVELACDMPSAKRKDFGFVTFDTHDAAVTCAKSINNEELGEGEKKAKVRARLSRPLQRSKGKDPAHSDSRPVRGSVRGGRSTWGSPDLRNIPRHGPRGLGPRPPHVLNREFQRPANVRDRRPVMAVPPRSSPVAPMPRSYDRRPPVPPYARSGSRDYGHRDELHCRPPMEYSSRFPSDRHPSYREDYPPQGSGYADLPRSGISQSASRRAYVDDGYNQRYERPPQTYREGHRHEYDSLSGSKRPYPAMDDIPPRYAETGLRHSRTRLDYDGTSVSHYGDAYNDRPGRSTPGCGGSKNSMSSHVSHGYYSDRGGIDYGSYGRTDVGGMHSSSYRGGYVSSRGGDVGASSYSSLGYGRGSSGSGYIRSGGSGSYH